MKKIICLLLLFLTVSLFGEENLTRALWHIVKHPFNIEAAKSQISSMVEKGYVPVGLHVDGTKELHILYLYNEEKVMDKWLIEYFDNLETFEKKCTDLLKQGWVPTGISRDSKGLFMLFINANLEIKEWKVTASWKKFDTARSTIKKYSDQGFSCYGISSGPDNRFWYIFLKTPDSAERQNEILITPTEPAKVYGNLYAMIADKWLPCGITMNDGEYNIMLVK